LFNDSLNPVFHPNKLMYKTNEVIVSVSIKMDYFGSYLQPCMVANLLVINLSESRTSYRILTSESDNFLCSWTQFHNQFDLDKNA
jgi:hypothetical protein